MLLLGLVAVVAVEVVDVVDVEVAVVAVEVIGGEGAGENESFVGSAAIAIGSD